MRVATSSAPPCGQVRARLLRADTSADSTDFISESAKFDGLGRRAGGSFHPGGSTMGGTSDFVTMREISRAAWPRQFTS